MIKSILLRTAVIACIGMATATLAQDIPKSCWEDGPFDAAANMACQDTLSCQHSSNDCDGQSVGAQCQDACDGVDFHELCLRPTSGGTCSEGSLWSSPSGFCMSTFGCGERYSGTCKYAPGSSTLLYCHGVTSMGDYCDRLVCKVEPVEP